MINLSHLLRNIGGGKKFQPYIIKVYEQHKDNKMIEIDHSKFIHILTNSDKILSNKDNIIYKHVISYINYKNKNGGNYNINNFIRLLSEGFKINKKIIYKLYMYF